MSTSPHRLLAALALLLLTAIPAFAQSQVELLLPLQRTAYQTNEWIDLAVVRRGPQALAAGDLVLTATADHGSKLTFTFPVKAAPLAGAAARATEHLHLNGCLLRPGKYTLEVAVDGATAKAEFDLYSHLRKSEFRLVNWGRAKGAEKLVMGEDSLGYNTIYGQSTKEEGDANYLRAGVDFIPCCVMGGGHQMDLRQECDWSDPYVTRGGTARVVQAALALRTHPNVPAIHFYDEPGLTWMKDPQTGQMTPHLLPPQVKQYEAAFGHAPLRYEAIDPKNAEHLAAWTHWARWKLGFMDAAWQEAQFGVSYVRPDLLSLTQSQYGFSAYTDGYYFNVARGLPITSGHGGYDDYNLGYFNPAYFLEVARARDQWKPCWYLPTWWGTMPSDLFRAEQYLSFQTGLQGMITAPDQDPAAEPKKPKPGMQGMVESNLLMQKLGPVFCTMPPTKAPVALLYSLSNCLHAQAVAGNHRLANYLHETPHGRSLPLVYLAGKLMQQPFQVVVEEDVLDGTLAADHQAVVLTGIDYLDAPVAAALEDFAKRGGLVLCTADCSVAIAGATKVDVKPALPDQETIDKLRAEKKDKEVAPYETVGKYVQGAQRVAVRLWGPLAKAGITPLVGSDVATISVTRQVAGDIEYLLLVNATYDDAAAPQRNAVKAATAKLALAGGAGAVYDAVVGGRVPEFAGAPPITKGTFAFGPGQMRVWACTARPIGGIRAARPVVTRQLVLEKDPIQVEIAATLLDDQFRLLSGSAPLRVQVIDPLGAVRYELYRATRQGVFRATLPLAANDPVGQWQVVVQELLNNTKDTVTFTYAPPPRAGALAGATPRAVAFGNDLKNCFRFARVNRSATLVIGKSEWNRAAAERLAKSLQPWDVVCTIVDAAEVNQPRAIPPEAAPTWVGLNFGRLNLAEKGNEGKLGFAVRGPVILLGSPADNPLIAFLQKQHFLPYEPKDGAFPGAGRGYVAWQRDGVGLGQESVTLIAYDAAGMSEAVGTFYEAVAGLDPLTRWDLPRGDTILPAKVAPDLRPAAPIAWIANLPDRVMAIKANGDVLSAITRDESVATLDLGGHVTATKPLDRAALAQAVADLAAPPLDPIMKKAADAQVRPDRLLKLAATDGKLVAVAYWGGTLRLVDAGGTLQSEQRLPQDITALAFWNGKVIAGLADGRVMAVGK